MPKKETTHTYVPVDERKLWRAAYGPPGDPGPDKPNATVGDAIDYAKGDPGGLVATLKWIAGFFVALFRPAVKKP